MKKYEFRISLKRIYFFAAFLMVLYGNMVPVSATNIGTFPEGSGNDIPPETQTQDVPVETPPEEETSSAENVSPGGDIWAEPIPEPPVLTEPPVVQDTVAAEPPVETESFPEEESTEETETEALPKGESMHSTEESDQMEIPESSEKETWPMGFSGAGDGQTTQEDQTTETIGRATKKEGGSTIAKIIAVIFMVLLIGGVVAHGYISMVTKEDLHRRERRARAWSEYGDEDNE